MSKIINYTFVTIGLMFLLNMAGINTTSGYILSHFSNLEDLINSNLYAAIAGIFVLAATVGAIVIGTFSRTSPESYLVAPIVAILMLFTGDIIGIIAYAHSNYDGWIYNLIQLLLGGYTISYWLSAISWWRGTDG